MSPRDDYVQKFQTLLAELNEEIDVRTERVENGGADLRDELSALCARQDEVQKCLVSLSQAGESGWQQIVAQLQASDSASPRL